MSIFYFYFYFFYGLISSYQEMRRELFVFQVLKVPYWNIRKFLILWINCAIFSEWVFLFFELGSSLSKFFILRARKFYFLKYKSSIFPKYKKSFFGETIRKIFGVSVSGSTRNFLILELESSISRKYKNFFRGFFFYFSSLGWKVLQVVL